jgi:hypothetical protein
VPDVVRDIAAIIGAALMGSAALSGVALWLFKLFGEKWLGAKFS